MRVIFQNTVRREWYYESGATAWGLGCTVTNFADVTDEHDLEAEGVQVSVQLGPWTMDVFTEGGAAAVFGDLTHVPKFGVWS